MDSLLSYKINQTPGCSVEQVGEGTWRLTTPAVKSGSYRYAQLDDYSGFPRSRFKWQAPLRLECSARISHPDHPGTWGFGLWNDPFTANIWIRGAGMRLPALPNVAWFLQASQESQLTLQNSRRANGVLAAVFQAPLIPSPAFVPAYPLLPLAFLPPAVRILKEIAARIVRDKFEQVALDQTAWNSYRLEINQNHTGFFVNEKKVFQTDIAPRGKLGALAWIDNQFAGIESNGKIKAGAHELSEPAWMEIKDWAITPLD